MNTKTITMRGSVVSALVEDCVLRGLEKGNNPDIPMLL